MANARAHQWDIFEIQKNSKGSYLDLEYSKHLNHISWPSPFKFFFIYLAGRSDSSLGRRYPTAGLHRSESVHSVTASLT
jgi:hypothetical protein